MHVYTSFMFSKNVSLVTFCKNERRWLMSVMSPSCENNVKYTIDNHVKQCNYLFTGI
ncbi:hypothetical protein [Escherichia phage ZCEC13]|uniref:Uncharacterized protein n=1 Tax=Escherichia phage ZCEC13 TaxID=2935866 RepID=A0AAE9KSZ6_9CAUD|nr:hypothetical protein [Escherichia phage ZCEC13]